MGARRIRREQVSHDQKLSRRTNGMRKTKERVRREVRMREIIQKGTFPYTPGVMSWISDKLAKPTSEIAEADVHALLKA